MSDLLTHCMVYAPDSRDAERQANEIQQHLGTLLDRVGIGMSSDQFTAAMDWCEAYIVIEIDVAKVSARTAARWAVGAYRHGRT